MSHAAPKPLASRIWLDPIKIILEMVGLFMGVAAQGRPADFFAPAYKGLSHHGYTTYGVLKTLRTPDIVSIIGQTLFP
jgi:hypothetical protein